MMKQFYSIFISLLIIFNGYSQSYNARFAKDIIFTEAFGKSHTDYTLYIEVNTASLVTAGKMQSNGNDIRFVADCGQNSYYDYYIHRGMNTAKTEIYVRIPSLGANVKDTIQMLYGDSTAIAGSNFNKAFPNAIVTNGTNTTKSGTVNAGWVYVKSGDTLNLVQGSILELRAGYIQIDGIVQGVGKGFKASSTAFSNGAGPGGGKPSGGSNSGSGGGGYGGVGGKGGYDGSSDPPGLGGIVNGNDTTVVINMGSSGSTGASSGLGGAGGGAIVMMAPKIKVAGKIYLDGTNATGALPQCAGGGAGGGALLMGDSVDLASTSYFYARGGAGATGSSTANDGGGCGGGGRVKVFGDSKYPTSLNANVLGGAGGSYGTPIGEKGDTGSLFTKKINFPSYSFGSEVSAAAFSALSTKDSVCPGDTATLTITNASSVLWSNMDTTTSTVVSPLVTTTYYATGVSTTNCATTDSITIFVPQLFVDLGPDTNFCGPTVIDAKAASGVSYLWSNNDSTAKTTITTTGTYSVRASQGGCSYSDTIYVRIDTIPIVSVSPVFDTICYGTTTTFNLQPAGGTLTGAGITGTTFNSSTSGYGMFPNYYAYTDAKGCSSADTSSVFVSISPTVNLGADRSNCGPSSLTATFNSGAHYTWNTNDSTRTISINNTGNYIVTVTIGNCSTSDTMHYRIDTIPIAILTSSRDTVCLGDTATLTGLPSGSGGIYSGTAVNSNLFISGSTGIGLHTQYYSFTDTNGCFDRDTNYIYVKSIPTVTLAASSFSICDGDTMTVSTAPSGGTLSGSGLNGSLFASSLTGVGSFPINYSYTDNQGCSNSITRNMVVHAIPVVSATIANDSMCIGSNTFLTGTPSGGVFTGNGVFSSGFNSTIAGAGRHRILYHYQDQFGCENEDSLYVVVHPRPVITWNNPKKSVCKGEVLALNASPSGGQFSGAGVVGNDFDSRSVASGTYVLWYQVTDNYGCSNNSSDSMRVLPTPTGVALTIQKNEVCMGKTVQLNGNSANGVFSGNGVQDSLFSSEGLIAGSHQVTYSVTNTYGCKGSDTASILVRNLPVVNASAEKASLCLGEVTKLIGTPAGGAFTGTGVAPGQFNSNASGVGVWPVVYKYADQYSCEAMDTLNITVESCLGLEELAQMNFKIYPNPSLGVVYIQSSDLSVKGSVTDAAGKLIQEFELGVANDFKLEMNGLATGLYYIHVELESGVVSQKLIVVQP